MREERVERQRVAVYRYDSVYYVGTDAFPLKDYRPAEGERIIVKATPYFSGWPVCLTGYNNNTVEQLLVMAAQQATPAQILQMIQAEQAARIGEDGHLQAEIDEVRNLVLGAVVALVFDDKAELDAWMNADPPYPHDNIYPADLRSGMQALMRAGDVPDYWWDGDSGVWRENEAKIDLSGYATLVYVDQNLALKAPLESPQFTGTPLVPDPLVNGYNVPLQAAPVKDILMLYELLMDTVGKYLRAADETPEPLFRTLRTVDVAAGRKAEFMLVDHV
ncbi:MAG: hypothetical protein LBO04_00290 [Spirochaetaceae bacterium]|jgi:hypothetical protein|nr:hypothetical protein [Spirochaetaceae bacterium]